MRQLHQSQKITCISEGHLRKGANAVGGIEASCFISTVISLLESKHTTVTTIVQSSGYRLLSRVVSRVAILMMKNAHATPPKDRLKIVMSAE